MRPLLLLPEMILFGGGLLVLVTGSFLRRSRLGATRLLAALVVLASAAATTAQLTGPADTAFEGTYAVDTATGVARLAAALGALLVLALAGDDIAGSAREGEVHALVLFATCGTVLLAGADDLLVLAVGYLLASIPLYGLIGLARTREGAEAAMKTYLLGALFGIVLLAGVTLLYGLGGTTLYRELANALTGTSRAATAAGVVAVVCGLMFKAGGVPAHFWVPDAAQGSGATVATFLTTVPKVGVLVAAFRLVDVLADTVDVSLLVAVLAVASMTLGNLAAYGQDDPRRLLGWSTVSQVGFLLVPVAVASTSDLALPSLLVYLVGYTATNVAAFAVSASLPDRRALRDWEGTVSARPGLVLALVVALLGLVGTPPTAVFVGKLTTASAAWDGEMAWLALVVLGNSLLSLFYYLRWIIPAVRPVDGGERDTPRPLSWSHRTAELAAVLSVALGLAAGPLWALADMGLSP
jgi:NADH-quinone oxidoreductase subunit N